MDKDYRPIACALHDEYEIAIMQKKKLNLEWVNSNGSKRRSIVLPLDLSVESGEEFLVAETDASNKIKVRLDKITIL